jgi:hypothetical protein
MDTKECCFIDGYGNKITIKVVQESYCTYKIIFDPLPQTLENLKDPLIELICKFIRPILTPISRSPMLMKGYDGIARLM